MLRAACLALLAGVAAAQGGVSTCSSDSQCRNGGACKPYQDTSLQVLTQCACANGYTGTYCDVAPNCPDAGVTCFNGGSCPDPGTKRCKDCPTFGTTGFRGQFCELNVTMCPLMPGETPSGQAFCANGGICDMPINIYKCKCQVPFGGQWCERRSFVSVRPAPPSGINTTVEVPAWVAAPIIIGIVLLIGTCGFLFFVIHRERKGQPVFTRLEAEGTRRTNLHDFAAAEEGQKIPEAPRYGPASPRTTNGA